MKEKIKRLFQFLKKELGDPLNIIIYIFVLVLFFSPAAVGYVLTATTGAAKYAAFSTAYLAFWLAPFTPAIPIQIAVTLAISRPLRRFINWRKKKRAERQNKTE